jgi:multidrug resistance efflux pump
MRSLLISFVVASVIPAPALAADSAEPHMLGVAVSALVAKILVGDNSHVEAGTAILQMDCRPLEMEIKVHAADLAGAEAAYERVRNGPRADEIAIGVANVGVAQARAEEARQSYDRDMALTQGVSVTRMQILETQRDARITAAQLNDAQKRLALLQAGSRAEDVAEALGHRDSAAATLATAQARLEQCIVRAPIAGTVELLVTPGKFISEFAPTPVAKLTPD